jgi:hypothetical protein
MSDRNGMGVRDLIRRFREGKPMSRDERRGATGNGSLWWQTSASQRPLERAADATTSQQHSAFGPAAARIDSPDVYDLNGGLTMMDSIDLTVERHNLQSLLAAARYGGHTQGTFGFEPLLSYPDVLQLHKSLEVEPVTAPPPVAPSEVQPTPAAAADPAADSTVAAAADVEGEPAETLNEMIENLEVTMTRLNWRCVCYFMTKRAFRPSHEMSSL